MADASSLSFFAETDHWLTVYHLENILAAIRIFDVSSAGLRAEQRRLGTYLFGSFARFAIPATMVPPTFTFIVPFFSLLFSLIVFMLAVIFGYVNVVEALFGHSKNEARFDDPLPGAILLGGSRLGQVGHDRLNVGNYV
jgi:hypothetical protein